MKKIFMRTITLSIALLAIINPCYNLHADDASRRSGYLTWIDTLYSPTVINTFNAAIGLFIAYKQVSEKNNPNRYAHAGITMTLSAMPLVAQQTGYDKLNSALPSRPLSLGTLFYLLNQLTNNKISAGLSQTFYAYENPETTASKLIQDKCSSQTSSWVKSIGSVCSLALPFTSTIRDVFWPQGSYIAKSDFNTLPVKQQ